VGLNKIFPGNTPDCNFTGGEEVKEEKGGGKEGWDYGRKIR